MAGDVIKKVVLKDGTTRYRFVVDVGTDPKTGRRRQLTVTKDRKAEAVAELARIRHEKATGALVLPTKTTVAQWLDTWLKHATRETEVGTAQNYADALLPVRRQLGAMRLQDVREEHVEQLVDWMLREGRQRGGRPGTGLRVRTVRLTLGRLRACLQEAVRRQVVVRNVAEYVRVPKWAIDREAAIKEQQAVRAAEQADMPLDDVVDVHGDVAPWSVDEARTFLAKTEGQRLHAVFFLALLGLRPAEVCGLRWQDVNLDEGTIKVANTRTIVTRVGVVEKSTKSRAGKRTLPLPKAAVTALRAFRKRQAAEKLAAGEGYEASGYVLVDELGRPQKTDWLRRRGTAAMHDAGVRVVTWYRARHACLSLLAASGLADTQLAAWAGHADPAITKRYYVRVRTGELQAGADALDTAFGKPAENGM